jgi:hypothetical protein
MKTLLASFLEESVENGEDQEEKEQELLALWKEVSMRCGKRGASEGT